MVGVIVCGGKSTRLFPCTKFLSKQLLPLYDKPLIYYPISMLMKVGIKDIAIVVSEDNLDLYKKQLGDGSDWGINIKLFVDTKQQGTVSALRETGDFFKDKKLCFVLGDNFFYGKEFDEALQNAVKLEKGAYCFGYPVKNPKAYGVAQFNKSGKVTQLIEKPEVPPSNMAVTGIYVYDEKCFEYASRVKPSKRNEYEVTDLNNMYLSDGELNLVQLSKKNFWLDAGTSEGLFKASEYVYKKIKKTKQQIGCLEEVAYKMAYISKEKLLQHYEVLKKTEYGKYLLSICK